MTDGKAISLLLVGMIAIVAIIVAVNEFNKPVIVVTDKGNGRVYSLDEISKEITT